MTVDVARHFDPALPEMIVQLLMALVLGGALGLERELRGRPAGLRTLSLVCLGSTLIMIVSSHLSFDTSAGIFRADPGRIAAGVITGIGFLGAGVILRLGDIIRGVTTAACIWLVAALGVAIGERMYALATMATLLGLGVLWILQQAEKHFHTPIYRTVTLRTRAHASAQVLGGARELLSEPAYRILDIKVHEDVAAQTTAIDLSVRAEHALQGHDAVKALARLDGVLEASWH